MSNSFFGNNMSKLDKVRLKEYEQRLAQEQTGKEEALREFNGDDWPEMHGAYQDKNGQWQV